MSSQPRRQRGGFDFRGMMASLPDTSSVGSSPPPPSLERGLSGAQPSSLVGASSVRGAPPRRHPVAGEDLKPCVPLAGSVVSSVGLLVVGCGAFGTLSSSL